MKVLLKFVAVACVAMVGMLQSSYAQTRAVTVTVENIVRTNGVSITPVWVGFHSGSFDSYNGGLGAQPGLERLAEDGNTSVLSQQFLDFNTQTGGYTYVDNSGPSPANALVRTGDLADAFRQDATLGSAPLQPGDSATEVFELRTDGSNDFFSYASMVLPTNDFFIANGNPTGIDISSILANGGTTSFFIGTRQGGINDAGTEVNDFTTSAGNGLFPGRNMPPGQSGPNQGAVENGTISNVIDFPYTGFLNRAGVRLQDLNFNGYRDGLAEVTISVAPPERFVGRVDSAAIADPATFFAAATAGELYVNIHTAAFPDGEIRGQLDTLVFDNTFSNGLRVIRLTATLDSSQEPMGASDSAASGDAQIQIVARPDGTMTYRGFLRVEGIPVESLIPVGPFSAIHIHRAPRGQNGPVLQDFIVDAGGTTTDFSVLED